MSDDEAEYVYEEDEVEYSSQDGEDDSNSNNQESSVKFHIPDGDYKILLYKDIQPLMESHTRDVSNLFSIAFDVANILLRKYKWNKERLIDVYYNDTEEILKEAGVSNQEPSTSPSPSSSIRCRICGDLFGKDDCYSLNCQHAFCKGCYGTYLTHQIIDGPPCVFAHCPEYKCKQAITISAVQSLCSQETYEKYMMYITRNFIETSASMRWCPYPGCERVAIGSGVTTVLCQCNCPFCFRCGQEAHDPATCAHLSLWQEKCSNESETANWILANTKKCPKCHTRIEKNQGCNHMNCKMCKHEFCWICMGSWSDHGQNTGGYYKCNKYDPQNSDNNAAKAKAELDRYLHYYQRYHGHDSALKFAAKQRQNAELKMIELQESEKSAWVDVQFLKQAVDQVIECRRVLKYTYVLGHFLKDGTPEKELYEHHQEMLEKHTETLSELTELSTQFTDADRAHVINLTRVTERFMQSMLNTVMDGTHNLTMISPTSSSSVVGAGGGGKESTP